MDTMWLGIPVKSVNDISKTGLLVQFADFIAPFHGHEHAGGRVVVHYAVVGFHSVGEILEVQADIGLSPGNASRPYPSVCGHGIFGVGREIDKTCSGRIHRVAPF